MLEKLIKVEYVLGTPRPVGQTKSSFENIACWLAHPSIQCSLLSNYLCFILFVHEIDVDIDEREVFSQLNT